MKGLDISRLNVGPESKLSGFKAGLASFCTDHNLAYGAETILPKNLSEVTANTYYGKVYRAVVNTLNNLSLGAPLSFSLSPTDANAGMEGYSISEVSDDRLNSMHDELFELCKAADIPEERIAATMESLALMVQRYSSGNINDHFAINDGGNLSGFRGLNTLYPSSIMADATYTGTAKIGQEMFGQNIQQKIVDIKTALTITLVKSHHGLTNRVMHRVSNDTGVVMFLVPNDEFYDLAKSNGKTSEERDSFGHRNQLLTLLTHPEPVDMEPIPVKLHTKMDTEHKFLLAEDVMLPDVELSLWDLATEEARPGYDQFNYSDLLSNKINLRSVHVEITDGSVTEQMVLNLTPYAAMTAFGHLNNTADNQADRVVNFVGKLPFDKDTPLADKTRSVIFSTLNRAAEYIMGTLRFTAMTNMQTTKTHGTGSLQFRPSVSTAGVAPSAEVIAIVKKLKAKVIGWEIDAAYSEENFRKTNMAVRAMSDVFTYTLPDGRTIVADYSYKQTLAEHTLQVASEVQTIGIDHRNLQIIMKTIRATHDRVRGERLDPNYITNYGGMTVNKSFVSGRRVHPTIAMKTIDMSKVVNFRSSDMLSDNWTYMRACLNAITTQMNYESLLPQALEDKPIKYKVITTTPLLDCIFALASIHENQMPGGKDGESVFKAKTPGKPVEFKTVLPNGVELEFVTTVFHYMKDQMIFLPYRENSPMDDLNFAINLDGGQYSVNWAPTDGHAMTIRRQMQNTREYIIPLCLIGAIVQVENYDFLTPDMFKL